jgi:acetoin utilization protein AcuB
MLVENWMSKPAITIGADAPVVKAVKLLKQHEIHMLPVMDNDWLAGIITVRDLHTASVADTNPLKREDLLDLSSSIRIRTVMTTRPVTVQPDCTVEETAQTLLVNRISGLPVVNRKKRLVGVITKSDIFQLILILSGDGKRGIQFALELKDQPGCVKEITDTIRNYGGRMASILSTCERAGVGNRRLYIRIYDIDRPGFQRLKEIIKETADLLYVVNHEDRTREIYNREELR